MTTPSLPDFDQMVDLLRVRLRDADAVNDSELHSFKELMKDQRGVLADRWSGRRLRISKRWVTFTPESSLGNGGDAFGRLERGPPIRGPLSVDLGDLGLATAPKRERRPRDREHNPARQGR
jgi:hypothetical protein